MLWVVVLQVEGVASTLSITGTTQADRLKARMSGEKALSNLISSDLEGDLLLSPILRQVVIAERANVGIDE